MSNRNEKKKVTGSGTTPPAAVGYKRPPVATRFRKGQSGHPQGRPKGRPNFANIVRKLFNELIRVKIGDTTYTMPAAEAVVRKLHSQASGGNDRALGAMLDIMEMTGRTDDVSDEERARRKLELPKPMSRVEYDLVASPARAKDRQRLLLRYQDLDAIGRAPVGDPDLIIEKQGTHRSFIASMYPPGTMLPDPPPEAIRIGLEADRLLYAGDFANAVRLAEDAIATSTDCDVTWMKLIVAHGRMFLGHTDESRTFYMSLRSSDTSAWTSWEMVILQEFQKLREAGHCHPLMTEIEQHLTNEGWTVDGGPAHKRKASPISATDREFMVMNPDSLKTGTLLEQEGQPDKATDLYRRFLRKSRRLATAGPLDPQMAADAEFAMERFAGIARRFLMVGGYGQAFELAQELLTINPKMLKACAILAETLMFRGSARGAREIFMQHRGEAAGGQTWENLVLEDFKEHRKARRFDALMDEIERLFGQPISNGTSQQDPTLAPVDEDTALLQASDIESGDRLLENGRPKEALAVYLRHLDGWDIQRSKGLVRSGAIDGRNAAVDRICEIALLMIRSSEFEEAQRLADRALRSQEGSPRANICKAHALMFLGQAEEARKLYLKCAKERLDAVRYGAQAIFCDFAVMRDAALSHPLMEEIEAALNPKAA